MSKTTRKYGSQPGEMPNLVDGVNTVNIPAKPKKSYTKTVIALFLICLAIMAAKAVPAKADT